MYNRGKSDSSQSNKFYLLILAVRSVRYKHLAISYQLRQKITSIVSNSSKYNISLAQYLFDQVN